MALMKGASCRALAKPRESTTFGYPGGAIMPFYDAIVGAKFKHILVRQRQARRWPRGYARPRPRRRLRRHVRPRHDEPRHRHRRRLHGLGPHGLHHRPGAPHLIGTDAFQGGRHLRHHAAGS
jgi:hypothetical protein